MVAIPPKDEAAPSVSPVAAYDESLADAAIRTGLPVIGCTKYKSSKNMRGAEGATTDAKLIRFMLRHQNAKLIGVPTGAASGLVAIDLEIKNGAQGAAWLDANRHRMPRTRTHRTPSGGNHMLFRRPAGDELPGSEGRIAPGVNVHADGGYVCWPAPGTGYEIVDDAEPADMPGWLTSAARGQACGAVVGDAGGGAMVAPPQKIVAPPAPVSVAPTLTLVDAAIALGVPVFPCMSAPGTRAHKTPLLHNWGENASSDPDTIRSMFATPAAAMIGVPTGAKSECFVVDVDTKPGKVGKEWLDANQHRLPRTYTVRTATGGLHLYFNHLGRRVKNNNTGKVAKDVDVRGDGGYVIGAGSPGYTVADDCPAADAPDWLAEIVCPPEPEPAMPRAVVARAAPPADNTPYGLAALDGECEAIRSAAFGQQEGKLNAAGLKIGALAAGGELVEGPAIAALIAAGMDMPNEPKRERWTAQDIEAKVRRAVRDGMRQERHAPEREAEEVHPAAELIAKLHVQAAKAAAKPLPVKADLFDVPGALRLFLDHCAETAISPQPFLDLAAGICAVGALAGRRYRTRTDLRSNVYAVGIADSGGGKDHARKRVKAAFEAAGLTRYLGGEDIASGAAVLTAVQRHPAMLFQIDEFGDWLGGVLAKNASIVKRQVAERLKALFSSAGSFIPGTEYANQSTRDGRPKEDVRQPHVCLYGTTTPGQFWNAIAGGSLHDGLMARILVFVSPQNHPEERDPDFAEPPEALVEAFQAIARGGAALDGNLAGVMPGGVPMASNVAIDAREVSETPEAKAAISALKIRQRKAKIANENTWASSIAARLVENAVKLALIRAVSRNPVEPVIDGTDVAWGQAVAEHCAETLMRDAGRNVADSQWEKDVAKCLDVVRRWGPITDGDFRRRGWTPRERDRAEILRTLIGSGEIVAITKAASPGGGRPTLRYRIGAEAHHSIHAEENIDD